MRTNRPLSSKPARCGFRICAKRPSSGNSPGATGWPEFAGEALAQAVAEINRHNQRKIIIDDRGLSARSVIGTFRLTDPDNFARQSLSPSARRLLQCRRRHSPEVNCARPASRMKVFCDKLGEPHPHPSPSLHPRPTTRKRHQGILRITLKIRRSPRMLGILLTIALAATTAMPRLQAGCIASIEAADARSALRAFASSGAGTDSRRWRQTQGPAISRGGGRVFRRRRIQAHCSPTVDLRCEYVGDHSVALVSSAVADTLTSERAAAEEEEGDAREECVRLRAKDGRAASGGRPGHVSPCSMPTGLPRAEQTIDPRLCRHTVPGAQRRPGGIGSQVLAIRGVTTSGFTLPTVGVTVDGVPYVGLLNVADPDPGDLALIEVPTRSARHSLWRQQHGWLDQLRHEGSFDGGYSENRIEAGPFRASRAAMQDTTCAARQEHSAR